MDFTDFWRAFWKQKGSPSDPRRKLNPDKEVVAEDMERALSAAIPPGFLCLADTSSINPVVTITYDGDVVFRVVLDMNAPAPYFFVKESYDSSQVAQKTSIDAKAEYGLFCNLAKTAIARFRNARGV